MTARARYDAQLEQAFVAAQFETSAIVDGELRRSPSSVAHAKLMGTIQTLCGLSTLSWFKFWDISFLDYTGERCPACSHVFSSLLPAAAARRRLRGDRAVADRVRSVDAS